MTFIGPSNPDLDYLHRVRQRRQIQYSTYNNADPGTAANISMLTRYYKNISPGLAYSLGSAGITPGSIQADQLWQLELASRLGKRPGEEHVAPLPKNIRARTLAQIESITKDQYNSLSKRQQERIKKRAEEMAFSQDGGIVSDISSVAGEAIGAVGEAAAWATQPIKTPIREATTVLQAGYEGLQAGWRQAGPLTIGIATANPALGQLLSGPDPERAVKHPEDILSAQKEALSTTLNNPLNPIEQTTLYQHAIGKSTGSGYFPNPLSEAGKAQSVAARKYSPYLIGGQAWTPGRALANIAFEPDDDAFKIASGLADAAVAIKIDPANVALNTMSAWRQARKLMDADEIAAARLGYGGIKGNRYHFAPRAFSEAIQSSGAKKAIEAIANEPNPRVISEATGIPLFLSDGTPIGYHLSKADTPEKVIEAIRPHAGGAGIAEIPKWKPPRFGNRMNTDVPLNYLVAGPDADLNSAAAEADKYLINAKATIEQRNKVGAAMAAIGAPVTAPEGGWTWASVNQGYIDRQKAAMGVFFDTVGESMKAHGASANAVDIAKKDFLKEWDEHITLDYDHKLEPIIQTRKVQSGPDGYPLPHPVDEETLLGWTVKLPDYHELRRDLSPIKELLDHPLVLTTNDGIDLLMSIWRRAVLTRPATAMRVVGEEMVRIAAMGYDSMWNHPLRWAAIAIGNPDNRWVEHMQQHALTQPFGRALENFKDAHGMRANLLGELSYDDDLFTQGYYTTRFGTVTRQKEQQIKQSGFELIDNTHDQAALAMVDELSRARQSKTFRAVAEDINLAKFRLREGDLSHLPLRNPTVMGATDVAGISKTPLQTDAPEFVWGGGGLPAEQLAFREVATDAQAEAVSAAIRNVTGNHPALVDALKTGRINGHALKLYNGRANKAAINEMQKIIDEDKLLAPTQQLLPKQFRIDKEHLLTSFERNKHLKRLDQTFDFLLESVLTRPSNWFSRNPMLQQTFLEEMRRAMPYMDRAGREKVLQHVAEANISKTARHEFEYVHHRLSGIEDANVGPFKFQKPEYYAAKRKAGQMVPEHQISYDAAVLLAKKRALDNTKGLLYDLSRRSQFFDMTRAIFPFGEAFKEVLTRWAKITWENPNVIRRLQQGVTAAESSGSRVINEVQGIPNPVDSKGNPTGGFFYKDQFGQEVFAFPGSQILTKATTGIPIPLKGSVQGLNLVGAGLPGTSPFVQIPMNYLVPDKPEWNAFRHAIFPYGAPKGQGPLGQITTALTPAWAQKIINSVFGNPDLDRLYAGSVQDAAAYLSSTGDYDLQGPAAKEEMSRLMDDAKHGAYWLGIVRGFGQANLPAAPSPEMIVHDSKGRLTQIWALKNWYSARVDKVGFQQAGKDFLNRFGLDNFLVMQAKSKAVIPGAPITNTAHDWSRSHPEMAKKYPHVYGLFAPAGGKFNQDAYESQFANQERIALTPMQALKLANGRLAGYVYDRQKAAFGDKITEPEADALRNLRQQLTLEFPGYGEQPVDYTRSEILINELKSAAKDPSIKRTEAGKALRTYLHQREGAEAYAKTLGSVTFTTSKATAPLRQALNSWGEYLLQRYPSFQPMWDTVFKLEIGNG